MASHWDWPITLTSAVCFAASSSIADIRIKAPPASRVSIYLAKSTQSIMCRLIGVGCVWLIKSLHKNSCALLMARQTQSSSRAKQPIWLAEPPALDYPTRSVSSNLDLTSNSIGWLAEMLWRLFISRPPDRTSQSIRCLARSYKRPT